MREIAKYIRLVKIASYERAYMQNKSSNELATEFCLICVVPLIIGLKLHNINEYYDFIEGRKSDPLLNIFDMKLGNDLSGWLFTREERNNYQQQIPITDINSKLIEIYNALFIEQYIDKTSKKVGEFVFNRRIKLLLLRIENLLSDFSDFNY